MKSYLRKTIARHRPKLSAQPLSALADARLLHTHTHTDSLTFALLSVRTMLPALTKPDINAR